MVEEDGWRLDEEKSEFILHIPLREKAHYPAILCAEGSPRAVGEGQES